MVKKIKKKLLVTGGTGFIGYHLILAAKKKQWDVTSISLQKPKLHRYIKGVKYIKVDITDIEELRKKLKKSFHYIVNLAGYGKHNSFSEGGDKIFKTHFLGLVNLTKIFPKKKIKKLVQIGSSEEYGLALAPQEENIECKPNSPYALGKLASTDFLKILYEKEKYPSTTIRLFLVYGPGQENNRILPQVINGCIKNKKFPISKGSQTRDFCYIDDVVKAILSALSSKRANGEIINIGSGEPQLVKNVVEKIRKILKKGKPQYGKIKFRKGENIKLYPIIKKAKQKLKWRPKTKFNTGLKITINSFKK